MPSFRPRPARAVADAPIAPLLARSEDLAQGWLLALIESVPLADAPAIAAAAWARDGPRVCEVVLHAIADDSALEQLSRTQAPVWIGGLAGGQDAGDASRAVDALQAVMWGALRSELRDPEGDLVAALSERLVRVVGVARSAALARYGEQRGRPAPAPAQGEASWVRTVEQELARAAVAVVVAELEDADRMLAVEGQDGDAFGDFVGRVRGVVREADTVVSEGHARALIVLREVGRTVAEAVGRRIATAVCEGPLWRGAPMLASVGVAVFAQDGRSAQELIDAAEEARFRAAASGIVAGDR